MRRYTHEQSAPSTTWTVSHGLGTTSVNVDVMIDTVNGLSKALPLSLTHVDDNTTVIEFTQQQSGKVVTIA